MKKIALVLAVAAVGAVVFAQVAIDPVLVEAAAGVKPVEAVSLRVGKGAAGLLLGLVDDLPCVADLNQSRQTERTIHLMFSLFGLDAPSFAIWRDVDLLSQGPAMSRFAYASVQSQTLGENACLPPLPTVSPSRYAS